MQEEVKRKIRNNPHYKPNTTQQSDLSVTTQDFDLELTAPIVKRKNKKQKPKTEEQWNVS